MMIALTLGVMVAGQIIRTLFGPWTAEQLFGRWTAEELFGPWTAEELFGPFGPNNPIAEWIVEWEAELPARVMVVYAGLLVLGMCYGARLARKSAPPGE